MKAIKCLLVVLSMVVAADSIAAPGKGGNGPKDVVKPHEKDAKEGKDKDAGRATVVEGVDAAKTTVEANAADAELLSKVSRSLDKSSQAKLTSLLKSNPKLASLFDGIAKAKEAKLESAKVNATEAVNALDKSITDVVLAIANAKNSAESAKLITFLETHASQMVGEIANGSVAYLEAGKFNKLMSNISEMITKNNPSCNGGCDEAFSKAAEMTFPGGLKESFDRLCK